MATGQEISTAKTATTTTTTVEGEVEIFLKIFIELVIKEPEEIKSLIEKQSDSTDGPALDAIILVVAKLRDLLKTDIDSLKILSALKTSLKILKNFLNFISQSKILYALKNATSKKHASKKRKTDENCSENVSSDQ